MKNSFVADSLIIAQDRRHQETNITIHARPFLVSQKSLSPKADTTLLPVVSSAGRKTLPKSRANVKKTYADTC